MLVHHELDKATERQKSAIDRNCMQGEDYRSQALVNYQKILELQEVITFIKAEPSLWKERYTALLT